MIFESEETISADITPSLEEPGVKEKKVEDSKIVERKG